jgi:pimeloyl-ACP methyl ester carboxylesterase
MKSASNFENAEVRLDSGHLRGPNRFPLSKAGFRSGKAEYLARVRRERHRCSGLAELCGRCGRPACRLLLVDYPGYGICDGNPTPQSILENAEGAFEALVAKKQGKFRAEALCVFGHSLGGAAALRFAARHRVQKIIAISTFTTMDAMVRATIRISLGQLLQTPIRQREFAESDPVVETSTRHIHLSWRSGRDHPLGNGKGPCTIGSESSQIRRGTGSPSQ